MMQSEKVARGSHRCLRGRRRFIFAGAGACPRPCASSSAGRPGASARRAQRQRRSTRALVAIDEARNGARGRNPRGRVRSARARADRGAAVRAARRGAQIRRAGRRTRRPARAVRGGRRRRSTPARSGLPPRAGCGREGRRAPMWRRPKALSAGRRKAAEALDSAVQAELPPLKLERARFITEIADRRRRPRRRPASTAWSSGPRPIPAPRPGR